MMYFCLITWHSHLREDAFVSDVLLGHVKTRELLDKPLEFVQLRLKLLEVLSVVVYSSVAKHVTVLQNVQLPQTRHRPIVLLQYLIHHLDFLQGQRPTSLFQTFVCFKKCIINALAQLVKVVFRAIYLLLILIWACLSMVEDWHLFNLKWFDWSPVAVLVIDEALGRFIIACSFVADVSKFKILILAGFGHFLGWVSRTVGGKRWRFSVDGVLGSITHQTLVNVRTMIRHLRCLVIR